MDPVTGALLGIGIFVHATILAIGVYIREWQEDDIVMSPNATQAQIVEDANTENLFDIKEKVEIHVSSYCDAESSLYQ